MPKKRSLGEATAESSLEPAMKTTAERHAEMDRAGLIHRVAGRSGQASFPLGQRKPGALKRFLKARD